MATWLSTYNGTLGLYNAAIITTIFGAFAVTFAVCVCWPKLVEQYGPAGGMLCAAIIVGTFWVMNHKLPGFGIHPEQLQAQKADGTIETMQFGLIHQGAKGGGPWVDMGWAIGMGFWVLCLVQTKRGDRLAHARESVPRVALVILGGIIGGAIVGLSGFVGAELFGWEQMTVPPLPVN